MEIGTSAPGLFAPGPVYVPERIRSAMAAPLVHHRSPQFKVMFGDIRERLKRVWNADGWEPLVFASSGSGAMEGAVVNFMRRDSSALVVSAGKFGERWGHILRAYGCEVVHHKLEWGRALDPEDVLRLVRDNKDLRAVYLTSTDTSTGVLHPLEVLAPEIRKISDALIVVDSICDFGGGRPLRPLEWNADVFVSCSQKCLLLPPGLGIAHIGPRAWAFQETADLPRFYFDWKAEYKRHTEDNLTAYTSPVSLMRGLQESLAMIEEQGMPAVEARYQRVATAVRAGVEALGLSVFPDVPGDSLTVVRCGDDLDGVELVSRLRDDYDIQLGNGQNQIKGKIFRIGHMGVFGELEVVGLFSRLEQVLHDIGHRRFNWGESVAAVQRAFAETTGH